MLEVSGLHFNSQVAAVDVGVSNVLMVYADNVAAELCDDPGYAEELTRLVEQLDVEQGGSAGLNKTAVNDSGQDSNVDVAAGYEAQTFLPFTGTLSNITAATETAPAPSAMSFCCSMSARIAAAISSSVTVTISSTYLLHISKVC